MTSAHQEI